jgi:signal transduction histidine kinase
VDEQAERLTGTSAKEAWLRWFWVWDVYFAIGFVGLTAFALIEDNPVGAKLGVAGSLVAMAVWYVAYGRAHITEEVRPTPRRGRIFIAGVMALLVVAVAFDGSASFALFAAIPMAFMSLDLKEAIPVVIVANLLPPASVLLNEGASTMFAVLGPGTIFTIVFAVAIGTWIHRIVSQSEERAELIMELERSRDEISRLSRETGVAAERARLAAEIHDTLAQGFTSLVTLVQAAESELDGDTEKARRHLTLAARTARENLSEARALVAGLAPSALGTGSLDDAIRRQVDRFVEETTIEAEYLAEGDRKDLPTGLEVVLLRAVQEALTNARKHSGARRVSICLRVAESSAVLRVTDDGCGFDPATAFDGYGLSGMRNRAEQVGGSLVVHSGTATGPEGTTVELEVPL